MSFSRRGFIGSMLAVGAVAALPLRAKAVPSVVKPILSGTPAVGPPLSVERGSWASEPSPVKYEWYLRGKLIGTGKTVTVPWGFDAGEIKLVATA